MNAKRIVAQNAVWNWVGLAVSMGAGFFIAPFLVHRLGETNYGLWILIASFTSYFGLLDLGVRGAVGRQVAYFRARKDQEGINAILSMSLAFLVAAGALAMLGVFGVSLVFPKIFDIPADQVETARWALLLVGLNLALWLPLNVFDATLWGHQRFDLSNAIDIVVVFMRTILTVVLVRNGAGLIGLSCINLVCMAGGQGLKAIASFMIDPHLRIGPKHARLNVTKSLFGYGIWYFLMSVSSTLTNQIGSLIVGARLNVSLVTPYNIASRLISYAGALTSAGAGVTTPLSTALHSQGSHNRQRVLFIEGGKYCVALAIFLVVTFLLLGHSLIVTWMGPKLASSSTHLLMILAMGEALPLSQYITQSMILGMGRHKFLAYVQFAEAATATGLAVFLAGIYGLAGICSAFAIMAFFCRGLIQLSYGCRLMDVSRLQYVRQVILPIAAAAAPAAAMLAALKAWSPPEGWLQFLVYVTIYALIHFSACLLLLVGPKRACRLWVNFVGSRFRKVTGAECAVLTEQRMP